MDDKFKRGVIRIPQGNLLRLAIPLVERVRTVENGLEKVTDYAYELKIGEEAAVVLKNGVYAKSYTPSIENGIAAISDDGELPVGRYGVEVLITGDQKKRYYEVGVVEVTQTSAEAGIGTGAAMTPMMATLEAAIYYYAKGDCGVGIRSVAQTDEVIDTVKHQRKRIYTITFSDGVTQAYEMLDVNFESLAAELSRLINAQQSKVDAAVLSANEAASLANGKAALANEKAAQADAAAANANGKAALADEKAAQADAAAANANGKAALANEKAAQADAAAANANGKAALADEKAAQADAAAANANGKAALANEKAAQADAAAANANGKAALADEKAALANEVANHPTYVGPDNYVYEYDATSHEYKKTTILVKGDQGLSAYEVALKNGFVGTEEEWLESLKGRPVRYGGVRFLKGVATTEGEPIGDLSMIANMKNILGLGGYLVENDHTRRKLNSSNHHLFEDGEEALLDGSMGHYQWGWGVEFYYATWEDSMYDYEAFSLNPVPGAWNHRIPVASMSRGYAALDRSSLKLVSYCNRDTRYRGGDNDSQYDGKWNTHCGKPVVNIAFDLYQEYAEKNGTRWAASWYAHIFIMGALMRIFFHNRDCQADWNESLTADGLHQGGLGEGIANLSASFGEQYATVDIDALADQGDALGVFSLEIDKGDGTVFSISDIPLFFGLLNPYHYLWLPLHGIRMRTLTELSRDVYVKHVFNSEHVDRDGLSGLELVGTIPPSANGWNYPKTMNTRDLALFPTSFGGSEGTFWADGFYGDGKNSGLRALAALCNAATGVQAGVGALSGSSAPSAAYVSYGASLCEAAEDWNAKGYYVPR